MTEDILYENQTKNMITFTQDKMDLSKFRCDF